MIEKTITPHRANLTIAGKYLGTAGVIDCDGALIIAFFSSDKFSFPESGALDGRAIAIHSARHETQNNLSTWKLSASYIEERK